MINLSLAAAFFLFTHAGIAGTGLRCKLVARIGRSAYVVFYSAVSLVGTVWLALAYLDAPYVELWGQLTGLHGVAFVIVAAAFLFVVIGLTSRPSTLFGDD